MSAGVYVFAPDPVWSQTTRSGFRQQVFVMYHATREPGRVSDILDSGFKISQRGVSGNPGLLLGDGLYVSRNIRKTQSYGDVCFKLLVYPGKTFIVDNSHTGEQRRGWQREYSSAWLPAGHNIHPSGLEETCVKSSAQVRILGIAYGYEHLDFNTQSRLKDCFGTGDSLDHTDNRVLDSMLEDLGIIYSSFVHMGSQLLLQADHHQRLSLEEWSGHDTQLWSRTWDNCLENKSTGHVLTMLDDDDDEPQMFPADQIGAKSQKWKLDGQGRFQHKQSKKFLCSDGRGGVVMKAFRQGGDRENWRFRCLDQSRETDSFVNFTPWHDLTVWDCYDSDSD